MAVDSEEIEQIKRWWKKYGGPLVTGLVIGLALVFGARAWFDYQERQRLSASAEYQQLQAELGRDNAEAVLRRGTHIIDTYGSTPYATLAALALAKVHVERGELSAARLRLEGALENAATPELQHIVRLRLARVLTAEGEAARALALLESATVPEGFRAAYEELKGDLHVAMGNPERARAAYLRALDALGAEGGAELVQMKLDDLGIQG